MTFLDNAPRGPKSALPIRNGGRWKYARDDETKLAVDERLRHEKRVLPDECIGWSRGGQK